MCVTLQQSQGGEKLIPVHTPAGTPDHREGAKRDFNTRPSNWVSPIHVIIHRFLLIYYNRNLIRWSDGTGVAFDTRESTMALPYFLLYLSVSLAFTHFVELAMVLTVIIAFGLSAETTSTEYREHYRSFLLESNEILTGNVPSLCASTFGCMLLTTQTVWYCGVRLKVKAKCSHWFLCRNICTIGSDLGGICGLYEYSYGLGRVEPFDGVLASARASGQIRDQAHVLPGPQISKVFVSNRATGDEKLLSCMPTAALPAIEPQVYHAPANW